MTLEDPNRTPAKSIDTSEFRQTQEAQRKTRAVAAEATDLLTATIVTAGMTAEKVQIKCPEKPITHAFLQFIDVDEREKYIRSANRQNFEARGRIIRITPAMNAEERYQQKRMGYIKLSLNEMHGTPFKKVFINRVDTRFHQVPRLRAESRRTQTIGWQKLVASTLSSRGTRARNQSENETTSSSGHTTQTATEEGDRGRGQGGGHKATPQQH